MNIKLLLLIACVGASSCQASSAVSIPIRLEAETGYKNIVEDYFETEEADFYSNGAAIVMSGRVPVGGSGTIEYALNPQVPPGIYTLTLQYNDENDGHSPVKIWVDDQVFSFVMDADTPSGFADVANERTVQFRDVRVGAHSILRVNGTVHRYESEHKELVRIDFFEFSKS